MAVIPSNGRYRARSAPRVRRAPRAAAAGMALAVCSSLVAGCGGSSKTSGGTAPARSAAGLASTTLAPVFGVQKPACGLVTQAEVEAAIGAKTLAPRESADQTRSVCSFSLASTTDQAVIIATTTSSAAAASFAADRARMGAAAQTVTAGDEAFVAGGQAAVRKGSTSVTLLLALRSSPNGLGPIATKIVQAIASRL